MVGPYTYLLRLAKAYGIVSSSYASEFIAACKMSTELRPQWSSDRTEYYALTQLQRWAYLNAADQGMLKTLLLDEKYKAFRKRD